MIDGHEPVQVTYHGRAEGHAIFVYAPKPLEREHTYLSLDSSGLVAGFRLVSNSVG